MEKNEMRKIMRETWETLIDPWTIAILISVLLLVSVGVWAIMEGDGFWRHFKAWGTFQRSCRDMENGKVIVAIGGAFALGIAALFAIGHATERSEKHKRGRNVGVLWSFIPIMLTALAGLGYGMLLKGWC